MEPERGGGYAVVGLTHLFGVGGQGLRGDVNTRGQRRSLRLVIAAVFGVGVLVAIFSVDMYLSRTMSRSTREHLDDEFERLTITIANNQESVLRRLFEQAAVLSQRPIFRDLDAGHLYSVSGRKVAGRPSRQCANGEAAKCAPELDLLPENWIARSWNFLLMMPWAHEERCDEAVEVHGCTDSVCVAPGGGREQSVEEVCRKTGISTATFYTWKKKYGGLMPSEMKRLKQLEEENARLKRIVADLSLDKEMLQDVIKRKL